MTNRARLIADALDTWAPSYPRRVTQMQNWSHDAETAVEMLLHAENVENDSPFVSVYSFPRGHTKEDNIPAVNTLFIDFDIEHGSYVPGSGDRDAWLRDLSELLVRARRVASVIEGGDREAGWRASLSGHKGIHLFLDFPTLPEDLGSFQKYIEGMNDYADSLVEEFANRTGLTDLDRYVDVTSSDLGRLCRVPNTIHSGATTSFGEERFCVPVTVSELAELTADDYHRLTRAPREMPWESRNPLDSVGEIVRQHVTTASPGSSWEGSAGTSPEKNWSRVKRHKRESNDNITIDDVKLLTTDMPCVWEYYKRDDKYRYGVQSRAMEAHSIAKLIEADVPIEVMHDFLDSAPEYDREYSQKRIEQLIAQDFKPFSAEKLLEQAPEFCGYDWCAHCRSAMERKEIA